MLNTQDKTDISRNMYVLYMPIAVNNIALISTITDNIKINQIH